MKWIIEQDIFDENYIEPMEEALGNIGLAQGSGYEIVKYVPFADATYLPLVPDGKAIVYGSINLLKQVQRFTKWTPGAAVKWKNYRCSHYFPYFHKFLLNQTGIWVPFDIAQKRLHELYESLGNPCFIKSDEGSKNFVGGVYDMADFRHEGEWPHPGDMMLFMDQARTLLREWRFFVVDSAIVAGSQYRALGVKNVSPDFPLEAIQKATEILRYMYHDLVRDRYDVYSPDPCFTIDIGLTANDEYKLIEMNAFNCAGFYAANVGDIVRAVHEYYVIKEEENE